MILLLSPAVFFIVFSVGPPLYVRYRAVSYPFLFLLLGYAVDRIIASPYFFRGHKHIVAQV